MTFMLRLMVDLVGTFILLILLNFRVQRPHIIAPSLLHQRFLELKVAVVTNEQAENEGQPLIKATDTVKHIQSRHHGSRITSHLWRLRKIQRKYNRVTWVPRPCILL